MRAIQPACTCWTLALALKPRYEAQCKITTDPLAGLCDWRRLQANPSLDFSDAARTQPIVDLVDAQYLLFAVSKKYRFLADITIGCDLHFAV